MNIIPGYWDPREMRFIEEPEAVEILRLQVVAVPSDGSCSDAEAADIASEKKEM